MATTRNAPDEEEVAFQMALAVSLLPVYIVRAQIAFSSPEVTEEKYILRWILANIMSEPYSKTFRRLRTTNPRVHLFWTVPV